MASPPISELSSRARDIFRLVVEDFLDTGQPVGSKHLADHRGVSLSPASIRSVLKDLEQCGLLAAPHTSAGRIPTDQGLRMFVDGIMQVAEPTIQERQAIERQLAEPGPIEAALEKTSGILSSISNAAGMVMVPQRDPSLAQMNIVQLDTLRALAVVVGQDGHVENRVLDLPAGITANMLMEASNYITARLTGRTLVQAAEAIRAEIASGKSALDSAGAGLVEAGLAVWSEDATRRPVLIVRGQANLLDEAALGDIERIRSLIEDLESKQDIAQLLELARKAEATRIFIGAENPLFGISGSSVIAAPYRDRDGKVVGVLGVIGPTRLNYARVVPIVDFTAQSLGKRIG